MGALALDEAVLDGVVRGRALRCRGGLGLGGGVRECASMADSAGTLNPSVRRLVSVPVSSFSIAGICAKRWLYAEL